jgi:hypothetical protein
MIAALRVKREAIHVKKHFRGTPRNHSSYYLFGTDRFADHFGRSFWPIIRESHI